jgi:hypothetical protein
MHNCLLCGHCSNDSDDEYGLSSCYTCYKRELDNDTRFPYRNTKCKLYENDTSVVSLTNKGVGKVLFETITWQVDDY